MQFQNFFWHQNKLTHNKVEWILHENNVPIVVNMWLESTWINERNFSIPHFEFESGMRQFARIPTVLCVLYHRVFCSNKWCYRIRCCYVYAVFWYDSLLRFLVSCGIGWIYVHIYMIWCLFERRCEADKIEINSFIDLFFSTQ